MLDFSILLRRKRKEAHLTQAELAQRVGVKQQSVARWERGASTPTRTTLASIAHTFDEPEDEWVQLARRDTPFDSPGLPSRPVRPRMDRLPLGELTPQDFERFTSYLLEACYPDSHIHRLGGPGHAQDGADILVRTSDGIHLFQCKRARRFGPAQMKSAANAAAATTAEKRVLVLSRVASPAARNAATSAGWEVWDHDDVVRKLQLEVNRESARRVLETFFPGWTEDFLGIREGSPWARPDEYFAGQTEESAFSHAYELIGRDDEIAKVLEWARGDGSSLLLTGPAGAGKSRFLMEAARRITAASVPSVVYFVEKTATVDLEHFRWLGGRTVIIVDDAHDRDDLEVIIRGSLLRSEQHTRPRLLFATRDYGKRRILTELAEHGHELPRPTVHLAPLRFPDASRLASQVLGAPANSPLVLRLAAVTSDCTLLLVAAGYLLKTKYVDPAFLDDEEDFRVAVLERMYRDHVHGAGNLHGGMRASDVLRFLAAVHPFDFDDDGSLEAACRMLGSPRDTLTAALGEIVRTGVVVKRGSRLRLQPDLLADHILVSACFDRTLRRATGYADRVWQASTAVLRHNLIVNVARIDWRLSETGISAASMLTEAWDMLEREFKESVMPTRLELLELLEKVAFYQPERTLSLLEWALDHELPPEHTVFGLYNHDYVQVRVGSVLRVCAHHREWLYRACELLWRLAQSDRRETNPHPDHPVRILCDLASYSRYKPFDHTQRVISQAIEWLNRDRAQLVFDILDRALRQEFDDHTSDGYSFTVYTDSALELGKEGVLALRNKVLCATIQQVFGNDAALAVRAAKSIGFALSQSFGAFGRTPAAEEMTVWESESARLLKRIDAKLGGARLSPPVAVALREAVDSAMCHQNEAVVTAAEEVMSAIGSDLVQQVAEMLIHGPWRMFGRNENSHEPSPKGEQRRLQDLARRFLEDSVETATAIERLEHHLAEISASSDASGAGQFVATLIDQRLNVGIEIVHRVIANGDSPLIHVIGVTLSVIRAVNAERALELARDLLNTGSSAVRISVAYAYGWGLASAPTVSSAELTLIHELAADDDEKLAHQLASGLRFLGERNPRVALAVILRMRIGRSEQLAAEVLRLFQESGPLRIDELGENDLDCIVEQLVVCDRIDDYWIQAFLASLSRSDLQSVVRLIQRRVEHAERFEKLDDFRPVPFRWHDKWQLESHGTQERRRILHELRDWTAAGVSGWRRRYEAPRLFAAVANEFDDEALRVIELGLQAPAANACNVANLLSEVPREFVWSHVQWIVRTLEDAARRDVEIYRSISEALQSALRSGVRSGKPGEPFPEDVVQRDAASKIADGLPARSPGERFYRSLQRIADHAIERRTDENWS